MAECFFDPIGTGVLLQIGVRPMPRLHASKARIKTSAAGPVTARKDDAAAAVQAAINNVAGSSSISAGGGLIHTTSG